MSSGKDSSEWPGMNQVVLISYFSKSFRSRLVPSVAAKTPYVPGQIRVGCQGDSRSGKRGTLTSTDVTCRVFSSVGTEPACNGIDVNSIGDENTLFPHGNGDEVI
jgi:hypothetical protein